MIKNIVIPVLVFHKNYVLDIEQNLKYIKHLNKSGISNIILLGTTSEGVLLSINDKKLLIDLYHNNLNENINIILCPSLWSVVDYNHLIGLYERIKDTLFLPNSYFNRKEDDMKNYIKKLYSNTNKSIYLYNLPKNTLVDFTPNDIINFRKYGLDIKGIKLSHSSLDQIQEYKKIKDFKILYGSDKSIGIALEKKADFVVSQNLSPLVYMNLLDEDLQQLANNIRTLVLKTNNKIETLKNYYLENQR